MRTNLMNRLGRVSAAVALGALAVVAASASAQADPWHRHHWKYSYNPYWNGPFAALRWGPPAYYAPPAYTYYPQPYRYYPPPAYGYYGPEPSYGLVIR